MRLCLCWHLREHSYMLTCEHLDKDRGGKERDVTHISLSHTLQCIPPPFMFSSHLGQLMLLFCQTTGFSVTTLQNAQILSYFTDAFMCISDEQLKDKYGLFLSCIFPINGYILTLWVMLTLLFSNLACTGFGKQQQHGSLNNSF